MSTASHSTPPSGTGHDRRGTRGTRSTTASKEPRRREGSRWGTWLPVGFVLLGIAELAILVAIGVQTSLWWSVLIVVLGWIVGVALVVAAGQQSFVRLRSLVRAVRGSGDVQDHLSRPVFTLLAALAFFFPGLLTDLAGLVLLLTPVQRRTVKAMGLGSGSSGARNVLYRRSTGGVIDGEIVIDARPKPSGTGDGTSASNGAGDGPGTNEDGTDGSHRSIPPTIVQD